MLNRNQKGAQEVRMYRLYLKSKFFAPWELEASK